MLFLVISPIKPSIYGLGSAMGGHEYEEFPFPQNRPSNRGTDKISQSPRELALSLNPPPLNLEKITADSQRRPDQAFIDRIDEVFSALPVSLRQADVDSRCWMT